MSPVGLGARLGLALGATALSLALVEGGFRVVGLGDPGSAEGFTVEFDPAPPFALDEQGDISLRPGFHGWQRWRRGADGGVIHETPLHTDARGLRVGEAGAATRRGAEILGLGDSVTFGQGVRAEQTFLAVAGQRLGARGQPVTVLNAGVPKRDLAQELRWLQAQGVALRPDLVLQCFYINDLVVTDLGPEALGFRPAARPPWACPEAVWRRRLFSFNYAWGVIQRRRALALLARVVPDAHDPSWSTLSLLQREWDGHRAGALFGSLHDTCARAGIPCAVVILPSYLEGPRALASSLLDRAAAAAQGAGLGVVRLDDVGADRPLAEQRVVPGDPHPNESAHAALGLALAERLPASLLHAGGRP